jgi:tRNA-dihydrouridine synthase C
MKFIVPKLILAPMEGVLDPLMRDVFTQINDFDLCITEFIRIVDALLPERVFHRVCPELHNHGLTTSNTPIRVQLLGQHPQWMAENAVRAIELGSHGVDINFGCPSKAVNKSKGGAALLKTPDEIYNIVKHVKTSIGTNNTLSIKIRLGFDDTSLLDEIVDAVVQGKADLLTIHARTKKQGYKPPAYWDKIGYIQGKYDIDLVANGEIWSKEDAINCTTQAKTPSLMLGRGVLATPNLGQVIKHNAGIYSWSDISMLLQKYSKIELQGDKSFYFSSRLKQWLKYLKLQYPQADYLFHQIKTLKDKEEILNILTDIK